MASALFDTRIYTKRNRLSKCVSCTTWLKTCCHHKHLFLHIFVIIKNIYPLPIGTYTRFKQNIFRIFFFIFNFQYGQYVCYKWLGKIRKSNIEWEASYITTIYAFKTHTCLFRFFFNSLHLEPSDNGNSKGGNLFSNNLFIIRQFSRAWLSVVLYSINLKLFRIYSCWLVTNTRFIPN